ncbi:MAG: hypothetical protein HYU39_04890 [Thaumarchaeota archaeon]|nr:hypothetical protein [Nitrososphaerota archaeon]
MTLQVTLVSNILTTICLTAVIAVYVYISIMYRTYSPSRAMLLGVSGAAVSGKLPKSILAHEASFAVLLLAGIVHFLFGHTLAYESAELIFAASYLAIVIFVLRAFIRVARRRENR